MTRRPFPKAAPNRRGQRRRDRGPDRPRAGQMVRRHPRLRFPGQRRVRWRRAGPFQRAARAWPAQPARRGHCDFILTKQERGLAGQEDRVDRPQRSLACRRVRPGIPAADRADRKALADAAGEYERVEVKWFNRVKGYGFVNRLDGNGEDVFVHMETVRSAGIHDPQPGQTARGADRPRPERADRGRTARSRVMLAPGFAAPAGGGRWRASLRRRRESRSSARRRGSSKCR